jgi:hypothetical protein
MFSIYKYSSYDEFEKVSQRIFHSSSSSSSSSSDSDSTADCLAIENTVVLSQALFLTNERFKNVSIISVLNHEKIETLIAVLW